MSGSSAQARSVFENVKWAHVVALLDVLRDYDLADEWHVERRYKDLALGYSQTLAFLRCIGLVEHEARKIIFKSEATTEADRRRDVIAQLVGAKSPYRDETFGYLQSFQIVDGEVVRRADIADRLRESACRNFLMDLGIVKHRPNTDEYALEPEYVTLYAASCEARAGFSAARVQSLRDERTAIGDAAEIAVVAWERDRLGPAYADRVKHVAPQNVLAGYDVLSATVASERVLPRYIEVKAVSRLSFQFFWSENEANVASVLGGLYYLYLVPIRSTGEPLISETRMICDPYVAVLSSADWEIEANVRSCRPTRGLD